MKNIKEKINKWEELNKLLPKTVNRFRVYEIIEEIEKQSLSFQKQEIVEEIEKMKNTKMVSLCCKKTMTYGNSTQEYRCLACGKICEPYPSKDYNQALTESIEKIKRLE